MYKILITLFLLSTPLYAGGSFTAADSQYINIDKLVNDISSDTKGTICGWIDLQNIGANQYIMHFGDQNANEMVALLVSVAGKLTARMDDASVNAWILEINSALSLGLHHVAVVQDGIAPVLYVDGVAVAQTFSGSSDKTKWINDGIGIDIARIGCTDYNSEGANRFLNNEIDDPRYYNIPLLQTEIQNIYRANGSDTKYTNVNGCKGYWPLNGGPSGSPMGRVTDYSGNGNNGIAVSGKVVPGALPTYISTPTKTHRRR